MTRLRYFSARARPRKKGERDVGRPMAYRPGSRIAITVHGTNINHRHFNIGRRGTIAPTRIPRWQRVSARHHRVRPRIFFPPPLSPFARPPPSSRNTEKNLVSRTRTNLNINYPYRFIIEVSFRLMGKKFKKFWTFDSGRFSKGEGNADLTILLFVG